MAGVSITIAGAAMPPRTTTSRSNGGYHFALLLPGDYVLTVTSAGFTTVKPRAHVGLGTTVTIDVTLTISDQHEAIEVAGVLDRHSATVAQTFDARLLASLPGSRNMGGLLHFTPATILPTVEVGGGTGIITGGVYGAYGRNNQPRHTIEGIVVTGLFGSGFTPDYGALEEVSILTAAQGAEWPSSGIHTDFVTKSGSNQYRGTLYGAFEHRSWQSSNIDAGQIERADGQLSRRDNQLWRYNDVNADIGGFIRKNLLWWYTSVRQQDVAARLVNFPAEPYLTRLMNYSGKVTYRATPRHSFVLYGQHGLNHQPYRLDPLGQAGGGLSATTAINEKSDSTADQRNTSPLWKGEWSAILSDSMVFEVRAGQFGWDQQMTPRSTAPRFEDIVNLKVEGGNRDWRSRARRNQIAGAASYFRQHRTGHHYLRFGGEAIRFLVQETWLSSSPGNVVHVRRGGLPSSVFLFDTPSLSEAGVWSWSAYASDAWQVGRRLTLTAGLRFDRNRVFLPAQSHPAFSPNAVQFAANPNVIDWNLVTPRFAAVFDMKGDGRTLVKFSLGRYRESANAALGFNANENSSPRWRQYEWADPNQSGFWEPGEEAQFLRSRGGERVEKLDQRLTPPVLDEAGAWLERRLPAGVTLRTGAVWRLERDPFMRQDASRPFGKFTLPLSIPDLGPDGVAGTLDDGPPVTAYDLDPTQPIPTPDNIVRNVPGANSEYLTWEIAATRQTRGRWSFGASFAHTWNADHASGYSGQSVRSNSYPLTPNDLINTGDGGRHEFRTWTAKAYGTFEGPWRLGVTPVLRHQSGQPFGRTQVTSRTQLSSGTITILMEPVGTRRMDNITILDVRIDRTMRVKGGRVRAFVDVFNLLNANPAQNVVWTSGESFLRPVTIVPPRIARAGLSFDW
jgi:hypothetical protein